MRIMGIPTTGPAVKNHISPKRARELIAMYQTVYHLWFLGYQRVVPQQHLHLLLHHLHHRIPYLMSTDTPKIQYQKEVEVRVESFGETRCMNPQIPKTKIKVVNQKKYKEIFRMSCLIGYRNSERIWSMKVVLQSHGETLRLRIETLPVLLMSYQWSREQKWNRVRVSTVYAHFPKDPNCDICLKTKITRSSCRRRAGTVVPRAEHFGDLTNADHKVLSEEIESRNNHRHAVVVQALATQWTQSYPCKSKSSQETQKNVMKFLEQTRKPKVIYTTIPWNLASLARKYPGIIVRRHHTDRKQMGLLREQCVE